VAQEHDRALACKLTPTLVDGEEEELDASKRRRRWLRPWPAAHPWYQFWTSVLTVLGLYSSYTTPFRLAFAAASLTEPEWYQFNSFGLFIDIVFVVDTLVSATCVLPDGVAKARSAQIVWQFFRSGHLLRDLLYAVPWDYISTQGGASDNFVFAIGMLRLLRLRLTFRALSDAESKAQVPYALLRFFRFAVMLSLEAHFFACCFYYLGKTQEGAIRNWLQTSGVTKPDGVPQTMWKQYLFSLYWSCTTLTSIGYGDITPQTYPEMMLTVTYMLLNYCISVYIIGNMTILATQADADTRKFRKLVADTKAFINAYQLPPSMQSQMQGVLTLRFNDAQEHREVMDALPPALRRRVAASMYRPLIERAYLFHGLSPEDAFVGVFATSLSVELYMPFVNILTQGNPGLELFFVASGSAVAVLNSEEDKSAEDEGFAAAADMAEAKVAMARTEGGSKSSAGPLAAARSALTACLPRPSHRRASSTAAADPAPAQGLDLEECARGGACVVHTLHEGDCFGEVAFVFHLPQPWSVRTTSLSRMLFIRHEFWERVRAARSHDARELECRVDEAVTLSAEQAEADATAEAAAGSPRAPAAVRLARVCSALARKVRGKLAQQDRQATREAASAAAAGDVAALRRVLASGVSPRAAGADGRTPLHVAAANGQPDALRYLLSRGADVNARDATGATPLFDAVRSGYLELVNILKAAGALLGLRPGWPSAAASPAGVDDAADDGAAPTAAPAKERGEVGTAGLPDEGTLLCLTVIRENGTLLASLISAGCNPSAADHCGRTGLHEAAAGGHTGALSSLLAAGAEPNVRDRFGATPLLEAVRGRHDAAADALRRAGGELGLRHPGCELTRLAAGSPADAALLLRLVRHGAHPDARNFDGRAAAHAACALGCAALAVELHAAGADFEAKDRWGRTPVEEAERAGHAGLVAALRALPPAVPWAQSQTHRAPPPAPLATPESPPIAAAAPAEVEERESSHLTRPHQQGSIVKEWFASAPSTSPPPPGAP